MKPEILASMMKGEPARLEFVRAAMAGADLAQGVDLLRTRPNETSFAGGQVTAHQLWQSVGFTSDPPTIGHVTLYVDDAVLTLRAGTRRLERMRLVRSGSVVRALVRDSSAHGLSIATVEIFGWEVLDSWLPDVEEALRLLETS